MKTIILFDLKSCCKNWHFLLLIVVLIAFGVYAGSVASFTLNENLAYNSPYQIAFITAFLSLTSMFFATLFSAQLALKEIDFNFYLIYFSLPISKKQFLWSRFASIFLLSLGFTLLLTIVFFIGREFSSDGMKSTSFNFLYYVIPIVVFTVFNTFLVVSITAVVGWFTKSKLFIYVSGLLLYILYMVSLLFSSSPFMANQLPQSKQAQFISAIFDPFGMSAFFYQTSLLSIDQRNTEFIATNGVLLANRIGILFISLLLLILIAKRFTVDKKVKSSKPNQVSGKKTSIIDFQFVASEKSTLVKIKSFFSFTKMNCIYVVKSIPFVLIVLSLLFAVGMEMYAEIEKGIRLPQKYASSGLMVSTIIQNFYVVGALVLVFYGNDLFWRSKNSNFHYIEESTSNYKMKFWSILLTLVGLAFTFTIILILEGIVFQLLYDYSVIEYNVYSKAFLFTTFPLILVSGLTLFFQKLIKNRYLSLAISGAFILIMSTSLGRILVKYPLLKFLQTINFDYSDMNGLGSYENAFINRLIFGGLVVVFLLYLIHQTKKSITKFSFWLIAISIFVLTSYRGKNIVSNYTPIDSYSLEVAQASYEKKFRTFQNKEQPTITDVITKVDLFPSKNAYVIKGNYVLENKTQQPINEVLINFPNNFIIKKAILYQENGNILVKNQHQLIQLKKVLVPNQKMSFDFELYYEWKPVNGHQSFNAIVENGSFMRISRYYPQIGYDASNEIEDQKLRNKLKLSKMSALKTLNEPKSLNDDFINLDMIISTDYDQIAIGIGELQKKWNTNNRAYFHFKTASPVPFRFAISSSKYVVKRESYKGKNFEIYYHPTHFENVNQLLKNAKLTMDYCEVNFGKYPFKTIRFAEVSSFTKGFAATAYPTTIYMTEDMIFHCNIKADKQQDVINELAGHELSHLWWGNSQINPDDRVGAPMLTETLAMYTELMLLKKMYGKEKAEEHIKMHSDIFESQKGFSTNVPLIEVTSDKTHISYSKGAVVMYQLSELIGEEKVNLALRNFLFKNKYPNPKPISTDFLEEVYQVADKKFHKKIGEFFEK